MNGDFDVVANQSDAPFQPALLQTWVEQSGFPVVNERQGQMTTVQHFDREAQGLGRLETAHVEAPARCGLREAVSRVYVCAFRRTGGMPERSPAHITLPGGV